VPVTLENESPSFAPKCGVQTVHVASPRMVPTRTDVPCPGLA
jgi:hypothetical protein